MLVKGRFRSCLNDVLFCKLAEEFLKVKNEQSGIKTSHFVYMTVSRQVKQSVLMSKKHTWTPEEDKILVKLIQERNLSKWVKIASILEQEFGFKNRNGKQCRDRYVNKLSKVINESEWDLAEDNILMKMHRNYGRRWTTIGKYIQGRGQNNIKNHFYSRLRKSIRDLNKLIERHLVEQFTPIVSSFLNKLIDVSAQKFRDSPRLDEDQIQHSIDLIERLFWGIDCQNCDSHKLNQVRKLLLECLPYGVKRIVPPQVTAAEGNVNSLPQATLKENLPIVKQQQDIVSSPYVLSDVDPIQSFYPFQHFCCMYIPFI